ncbi:MAG: FtsX-like permease family protein [Clostridia bacterium]|nr:FtsX-like permease family protein [Clostridia bacterium]
MTKQPSKTKRARGVLTKKLLRDMRQSAMQFFALFVLCFLGTFVFAGLDANWRTLDLSFGTYFTENNIADLWVKSTGLTAEELRKLSHTPGVADAIARTNLNAECPDLAGNVTLNLMAFEGESRINIPYLRAGALLSEGDRRGILLEEQFADAHGLHPGDRITLRLPTGDADFTIRGTVLSPEYIVTSNDVGPDPNTFGFAIADRSAVQALPLNELLLKTGLGTDTDALRETLNATYPGMLFQTVATNPGTATAQSFVTMFQALCFVFPVLAYAVAVLIVVTTLTRMIENQRIQIGTLKALGFPGNKIRNHYLTYALVPSLTGSLLGLILGRISIPGLVWSILGHNARMPYMLRPPVSALSWAALLITVLLSLAVCGFVYRKASHETAAELLRPKPPKSGTRILLERWTGLWRRLSFNGKMVVRNIFRNKGRSLLSLTGILCCNMLIVCSFSLQDSFSRFIGAHFTEGLAYDVRADLKSGAADRLSSYRVRMDAESVEGIMEKSVSVTGNGQTRVCLMTAIPQGQQSIRLGAGHENVPLPDNGALVSRKLCEELGVVPGDTLSVALTGDPEPVALRIEAYAETTIGQGIYLSDTAWNALRKGPFVPTALLLGNPSDALVAELSASDDVAELKYPSRQHAQTLSIMDTTATAFTIFSLVALLLSFVICYNMGLMNFAERTRDYATLKVLGYHQREIRRLMMREQQIISVVATLLGIYPGMVLTDVILKMCEYDNMVFTAMFKNSSIVLACAISIAFAWFTQALLTTKVKKIDMVESLKSVE